jgi:hypothetical protein
MAPDEIERREKLIATWRAIAEAIENLGHDPREVFNAMAAVALEGLSDKDEAAPEEHIEEERREDVRLPPASWDFDFEGRLSEH